MKRFFLLFSLICLGITLNSCDNDDDKVIVDNGTIAEVYELNVASFAEINPQQYIYSQNFRVNNSEHILVYWQSGITATNKPIWELVPTTNIATAAGTIIYRYDFNLDYFNIYAEGNYDILGYTPQYLTNQWFRVVVIRGFFAKSSLAPVDYSNYNAVVNYFNINEKKIKSLKLKE